MKNKILCLVLILSVVVTSGLFAKEVKVNNKVKEYAEELSIGTAQVHKSNLVEKKSGPVSGMDKSGDWKNNTQGEYEILNTSKVLKQIEAKIGKKLSAEFNSVKEEEKNFIRYNKKGNTNNALVLKEKDLDIDSFRAKAESFLSDIKELEGNIEYSLYSVDSEQYMKSDNESASEVYISKVNIRFRRLFEGGAVRKGASYIELAFDGNKELCDLEVKWPDLKKLNVNKRMLATEMPLNMAIDKYSTLDFLLKDGEEVYIDSIEIIGLERGWCPIIMDGKFILTPVHTIVTKIYLEDGGSKMDTIDLPLIEEYYSLKK